MLGRFMCHNIHCVIYTPTQTLKDRILEARGTDQPFLEGTIWKIIHDIAVLMSRMPPDTPCQPKHFRFMGSQLLFHRTPPIHTDYPTMVVNLTGMVIYDPPEIITRQQTTSPTYLNSTWTLGCIAYEIAALEPAYYDREGDGNVIRVMMDMNQGNLPPHIPETYSDDLWRFIRRCLSPISERQDLLGLLPQIRHKVEEYFPQTNGLVSAWLYFESFMHDCSDSESEALHRTITNESQ